MTLDVFLGIMIPVLTVVISVAAFFTVVTYIRLILKRFFFKLKIDRKCKKAGASVEWKKSWFFSMFSHRGGIDFVIGGKYGVRWISAPFKFTRMHFQDENQLWLQINRTAKRARTLNMVTVSKYKLGLASQKLAEETAGLQKVIFMYPAPGEITKISGSTIIQVGNGDPLFGGFTYCDKLRIVSYIEDCAGSLK